MYVSLYVLSHSHSHGTESPGCGFPGYMPLRRRKPLRLLLTLWLLTQRKAGSQRQVAHCMVVGPAAWCCSLTHERAASSVQASAGPELQIRRSSCGGTVSLPGVYGPSLHHARGSNSRGRGGAGGNINVFPSPDTTTTEITLIRTCTQQPIAGAKFIQNS